MTTGMWVLAFLVTGWEGKGDGIDLKAFWSQESCERALIEETRVRGIGAAVIAGERFEGYHTCIYEPQWNAQPWHEGVPKEEVK